MRIVFHGEIAGAFRAGFEALLPQPADVIVLPDQLASESDRQAYAAADVIVSFHFERSLPRPDRLTLFHVPGAGYDAVDLDALPATAVVCNCFGHDQAIAEYVMAALLLNRIPFVEADRHLRTGDWAFRAGPASNAHGELAGRTIGILGFGHIGKAVAARAHAFEMTVHVANRSRVASPHVDRAFSLDQLDTFYGLADFVAVTLPLTPETRGIVGAAAFAAMRPAAVVVNVGRGPLIEEQPFYDALRSKRIAGAIIDTWYQYPSTATPNVYPSTLPFHELSNVVMTPHMSGWSDGTIRRRQQAMALNIRLRLAGEPCQNVVRPAQRADQ